MTGAASPFRVGYRVQVLLPTVDNDGVLFPRAYFAEFERHVVAVVGGCSRRDGHVVGSWCCASRTYCDRSREYFIDVEGAHRAVDVGVAVSQFVLRRFDQLAASVAITPIVSTLFTPRAVLLAAPSRWSWAPVAVRPRVSLFSFVVLAFCLFLSSCKQVESALTYVGATSAPVPGPLEVDVVCDVGVCTPERLRAVSASVLGQVALRPGSVLRVWWLANSVGETSLLATVVVPASRGASARALVVHREQVVAGGVALVERASAPFFRGFVRRRSPILEGMAKVSLASDRRSRELWLLSDLLEESLYGFECAPLPDEDGFRRAVAPLLPEDSLRGVRVVAVFAAPNVIDGDRCPVSVERFRTITGLYEVAVASAGGTFVLSPTRIPTVGGAS